jgi:type IV pilus assembly protein PilX
MRSAQKGFSLIAVTVVLLLTLLLVLGTFRTVLFHEILQGSSSDYQRTFAGAEALLRDAEIDIRGHLPPYTTLQPDGTAGAPCRLATSSVHPLVGCRERSESSPWFPRTNEQFEDVRDLVLNASNTNTPCLQGICFPNNSTALANIAQRLDALRPLGACYGQYTQQSMRNQGLSPTNGNPVLQAHFDSDGRCTQAQGWYWVEAFRYAEGPPGNPHIDGALRPDPSIQVVYRITALAQGLKASTQVVLQSYFVPYPASQNQ